MRCPLTPRAIACANSRRLDRSAKRGAERPCFNDKQLIGDRRSLHAALRALVETTEIFASTTCDSPGLTGEVARRAGGGKPHRRSSKRHDLKSTGTSTEAFPLRP